MLLEVASAAGGLAAGMTLQLLPERVLYVLFALLTAAIAAIMLRRLDRRNILDADVDPGRLGGRYFDDESGREVVYRVKRLPVGIAVSSLAGYVSGAFGMAAAS